MTEPRPAITDPATPGCRSLSDPRFVTIPVDIGVVTQAETTTLLYVKPQVPPQSDRPTVRHRRITQAETTTLRYVKPQAAR